MGVGKISKSKVSAVYAVDTPKEIFVILNHFDNYPLVTHKLSDYLIFKKCFDIIKEGEHLTENGLLKIISLKSSLNLGLPENLKSVFPNVIAKKRPHFLFKEIPDPNWVSGFVSGDGSFHIVNRDSESNPNVFARFSVHLHKRELDVLNGLFTYLRKFYSNERGDLTLSEKKITILENSVNLQISKFSDIDEIIIPFFTQYPILGIKSLDFKDFKSICKILKTREHLNSPLIFKKIQTIKSGMNLNRK